MAILRRVLDPLPWVLAAIVAAIPLLLLVQPLERQAYDVRLRLRPPGAWPEDFVLVPITDSALRERPRWPWPRPLQAELLDRLRALGAKTLLLDFTFVAPTTPGDDARMASALERAVLPIAWSTEGRQSDGRALLDASLVPLDPPGVDPVDASNLVVPMDAFAEGASALGFAFFVPDADGLIRRHHPLVPVEGRTGALPSLALRAWMLQRGLGPGDLSVEGERFRVAGGTPVALHRGEILLDYAPRDAAPPPQVPAEQVLDPARDAESRPLVEGRLALVYVHTDLTGDRLPTPVASRMPGGLIQAYAVRTIALGRAPRVAGNLGFLAVLLVVATTAAVRFQSRPARQILFAALGFLAAYGLLATALVPLADLFLPVVSPAIFVLAVAGSLVVRADRAAERDRRKLRTLLEASTVLFTNPPGAGVPPEAATVRRDPAPGEAPSVPGRPVPLSNPVEFGPYEVVRCLGRGGMGAIFLARDRELDRDVAIKVLVSQDGNAFTRFRTEAMAVARLNHPNVVQIYQVGFDASVPYLVIEYVPGGTLGELLQETRVSGTLLDWRESARLIAQVAAGLGAAHARGIVHRDVKPSNILLDGRGPHATAKIADFGIAKLGGNRLTTEGMVVGTVGYMAPEQAAGDPADPRSDVFSLGVAFYRALTGMLPFEGTTAEILRATVFQDVPDPRRIRPDLPEEAATLAMRMTARNPLRRPPDGNAVARELEALHAAETQAGRRPA